MGAGPSGIRATMSLLAGLLLALLVASVAPGCVAEDLESALPPLISWRPGDVRVLLLTDCAKYQDWQTIAAAFAWRESGQPGGITRVANCKEEDRNKYPQAMLDYIDTFMAPEVRRQARQRMTPPHAPAPACSAALGERLPWCPCIRMPCLSACGRSRVHVQPPLPGPHGAAACVTSI